MKNEEKQGRASPCSLFSGTCFEFCYLLVLFWKCLLRRLLLKLPNNLRGITWENLMVHKLFTFRLRHSDAGAWLFSWLSSGDRQTPRVQQKYNMWFLCFELEVE